MSYIPRTPFRRAIKAAITVYEAKQAPGLVPCDKWQILKDLATARSRYGLSDRDISVLQALLSFRRSAQLDPQDDLVVFPSNKSICERLNGMPNSTMRRHIARLVEAGVIARRDSPNGKRYVRRRGAERMAYGFDLGPFLQQCADFAQAARDVRDIEDRVKHLREQISLMRRDLIHLVGQGRQTTPEAPLWDQLDDWIMLVARELRRKLDVLRLVEIMEAFDKSLCAADRMIEPAPAAEMSTDAAQIEHHQKTPNSEENKKVSEESGIEFQAVVRTCSEFTALAPEAALSWTEFIRASHAISPMMGIRPHTWRICQEKLGPCWSAVLLALMLEEFDKVKAPDAYLNALVQRKETGAFQLRDLVAKFTAVNRTMPDLSHPTMP